MKWLFSKPISPLFGARGQNGCAEAEALIQRSLDEPLTASERKRLDAHVAGCESCRQAWDEYRRLSRAASQWLTEASTDPGDEFAQRVMADLGLTVDASGVVPVALDRHAVRPSPGGERKLWWGLAGSIAILVIVGLSLPPSTHLARVADAYTPPMPIVPSTPAQWWSTVRPQAGEIVAMVQSWTWPLYVFAAAFAANIAMALTVRRRGRAA